MLTITRWVFDGLRLVSLAQEACARRGWDAADRLAVVQHEKVATFLLKKTPFTPRGGRSTCAGLREPAVHRPLRARPSRARASGADGRRALGGGRRRAERLRAADPARPTATRSTATTRWTSRPTTDDRPFFFHTTKLKDQLSVAFGRIDALRQRPQRADDAHGHLGRARAAVRRRPAGAGRARAARHGLAAVARLLRAARRRRSCSSRSRCCSGSCCCSATRSTR